MKREVCFLLPLEVHALLSTEDARSLRKSWAAPCSRRVFVHEVTGDALIRSAYDVELVGQLNRRALGNA
eukprot:384079-Amphidinium_carterae.2